MRSDNDGEGDTRVDWPREVDRVVVEPGGFDQGDRGTACLAQGVDHGEGQIRTSHEGRDAHPGEHAIDEGVGITGHTRGTPEGDVTLEAGDHVVIYVLSRKGDSRDLRTDSEGARDRRGCDRKVVELPGLEGHGGRLRHRQTISGVCRGEVIYRGSC